MMKKLRIVLLIIGVLNLLGCGTVKEVRDSTICPVGRIVCQIQPPSPVG